VDNNPSCAHRPRSRYWIRSTGQVERVDGRSVRIHGLFQDVTNEQSAKAELERSRLLHEELSALSGIGGWEYDPESNRVYWSRQTRRIFDVEEAFEPTPESMRALFAGRVPLSGVRAGTRLGPRRQAGPIMLQARPAG